MLKRIIILITKFVYRKQHALLKENVIKTWNKINTHFSIDENGLLVKLLISGEDHRFRYHAVGFDVIGIVRALKNNSFYKKKEGASTIEQQLVRVLLNDFDQTARRKIREIFLASTLSTVIDRPKIPVLYLSVAYYGTNMDGLEQLANHLNISDINAINIEIAAEIISRIKYPQSKTNNPKNTNKIQKRKIHLINLYKKHRSATLFPIYG